MFFMLEDHVEDIKLNVDRFMDSYARDLTVDELKEVSPARAPETPLKPSHRFLLCPDNGSEGPLWASGTRIL